MNIPQTSQSQSVFITKRQWRSLLHMFGQGPRLMKHDFVTTLSLILEEEEYTSTGIEIL